MRRIFLLLVSLTGLAVAVPAGHWVNTWVTMPQLTEYSNVPNPPFNETDSILTNSTIRQTLHTSIPASSYIRVRISNPHHPSWRRAGTPEIVVGSIVPLTFSGNQSIIIPNGAHTQSMVTVDLYTEQGQQGFYITSHPGSRTTSWYSFGNYVGAPNMTDPSTQNEAHWFFLSGIEAWSPLESSGWVIVGDSITDGRGSDTDGNDRCVVLIISHYPRGRTSSSDTCKKTRSQPTSPSSTGGNRILYDGLGPNALSRIDRDVLAQSGIKYIQAYRQIIARAHTFGLPIFAATIMPFGAPNDTIQPYSDPLREQTRVRINDWIMGSGAFDGVIDFASIVADPTNAMQLNPAYHSGDFLHPNVAGYTAIANVFPIELFEQYALGVSGF
ncbi:hypothetical protein OG21DRAFT_1542785 [Imleria badia]|nr:hypothetical protein OG21DRAFT_1542785 [Imleria badia]